MLNSAKNDARQVTMRDSARSYIASVASDVAAINASGRGSAEWIRAIFGAMTSDNRGLIFGISLALISLGCIALLPRAPLLSRGAACEGLTFCVHPK